MDSIEANTYRPENFKQLLDIRMPLIQISLVEGRDPETVKRFAKQIARTTHETLGAPMSAIRVIVSEVPATHWAVGDETRDDIDARAAAAKAFAATSDLATQGADR